MPWCASLNIFTKYIQWIFTKGYETNFTEELFKIARVIVVTLTSTNWWITKAS